MWADAAVGITRGHEPLAGLWCARRFPPCDLGLLEETCQGVNVTDANTFLHKDVRRCVLYKAKHIHVSNKNKVNENSSGQPLKNRLINYMDTKRMLYSY